MPFRKGRPAASTSMATAKAPLSRTRASFSRMSSIFQGLTVGTPTPPTSRMALVAWTMTLASRPSPVKAAMPAWAQPLTRAAL